METFKKIENNLYFAKYGNRQKGTAREIWKKIKKDQELLNWATEPTKDKFGERDLVNGLAICEDILLDYDSIDKNIYEKLVELIYTNKQIARIVLDGYDNGGYSYLLMTLWNPNLELTEGQKAFAVDEAMNKTGTTRYKNAMNELSNQLDKKGITDEQTIYTEFGSSINPVGAKTGSMYIADLFNGLSDNQAHGFGEYDIRYWILKNHNWSTEEKKKLIMDFWADDREYDETLEQWEWGIINDSINDNGDSLVLDAPYEIYNCSYEELLEIIGNEKETARIWEEIQFCRQMFELRPPQRGLEPNTHKF